MPLLGMLAAGAAGGVRNASNANVQAANQMETDDRREMMRQQFLDRQYQQTRADNKENFNSRALLNQAVYERERGDKITDNDAKHKQAIEIEGFKDKRSAAIEGSKNKRSAATNAARMQSALLRKEGKGADGKGDNGKSVTLANGETFTPNSPELKLAVDLVKIGEAADVGEGLRIVLAKGLTSQAAQNPQSYTKGSVNVAKDMTNSLFSKKGKSEVGELLYEDLLK